MITFYYLRITSSYPILNITKHNKYLGTFEQNNMPEDLTKTLLLKRSTKKKSGYLVAEEDNGYYLETAPSKARVNSGDRVVGINGIPAEEFLDADDANGLIESIRIVVVPKDKVDEYDRVYQADDIVEDEEDYEEYDRARGVKPQFNGLNLIICDHCNCENRDLEPDEDGDLVCEECGHVMEPDVIHFCERCDYENINLERDEEGDLVCEECGCILPEVSREPDDEKNVKSIVYECPDCEHKTMNPEPDEEGDRICEECGCILPEKNRLQCEICQHENIEPKKNEEGDFLCEHCGSALDVDDEYEKTAAEKLKEINEDDSESPGGGQQFDESGKPTTNAQGKKLTPADMFSPGDVITVTVGKSNPRQDPGLKVEEKNGKYYVRKVPSGGLFARTPVIAGDKILELNGIDSREYKSVNEMKKVLKDEPKITVVVLRRDPDASESSASSVDYDELKAIKPPTKDDEPPTKDDDDATRETEDDDSVPYDGEDCGCAWCPQCHEL